MHSIYWPHHHHHQHLHDDQHQHHHETWQIWAAVCPRPKCGFKDSDRRFNPSRYTALSIISIMMSTTMTVMATMLTLRMMVSMMSTTMRTPVKKAASQWNRVFARFHPHLKHSDYYVYWWLKYPVYLPNYILIKLGFSAAFGCWTPVHVMLNAQGPLREKNL